MTTNIGTQLFGLTDKQYDKLGYDAMIYLQLAQDTTHVACSGSVSQLTKIGFMMYADKHGDFQGRKKFKQSKTDKIMNAAFESFPADMMEKVEIAEYIELAGSFK